jgi:hypothetical protein
MELENSELSFLLRVREEGERSAKEKREQEGTRGRNYRG